MMTQKLYQNKQWRSLSPHLSFTLSFSLSPSPALGLSPLLFTQALGEKIPSFSSEKNPLYEQPSLPKVQIDLNHSEPGALQSGSLKINKSNCCSPFRFSRQTLISIYFTVSVANILQYILKISTLV